MRKITSSSPVKSSQTPRPAAPKAAAESKARRLAERDEMSTGRGLRLRQASFRSDGGVVSSKVSPASRRTFAEDPQDAIRDLMDKLQRDMWMANRAVKSVQAAYESGGAAAAAAELKRITENLSPEQADLVLASCQAQLDQIVADLGRAADSADGGQRDQGPAQVLFDQTVADLSFALSRGASGEMTQHVSAAIADQIEEHGIGRWDEALGNTLVGGPFFDGKNKLDPQGLPYASSALAQGVILELQARGKKGTAEDILRNVTDSVEAVNNWSERVEDELGPLEDELAAQLEALGPNATDAQRRKVIAEFSRKHPEYLELSKALEVRLELVDQLMSLPAQLSRLNEGTVGLLQHALESAWRDALDGGLPPA